MSKNITLIVPCYNEANRIDLAAFHKAPANVRFVFVDDGSRDHTSTKIEAGKPDDAILLRMPRNAGKAEAVRQGMLHVLNHPADFKESNIVGFWDADLATPLSEVSNLEAILTEKGSTLDAVIGSRIKKLGSRIERSLKRHILGRIFTTISDNLLNLSAYDTQCGAKIFRKDIIAKAFSEPFVSRWVFDVEVLLRLGTERIVECPLKSWRDVRGSKINIPSASIRIIRDLWVIRKRYRH
jgi:glycosyltransferase involved in cell wall biosynthesis